MSGLDSPLTAWRKNSANLIESKANDGSSNWKYDSSRDSRALSRRSSLDPLYVGTASMFDSKEELSLPKNGAKDGSFLYPDKKRLDILFYFVKDFDLNEIVHFFSIE